MSRVIPQFTYSPEGIFTFNAPVDAGVSDIGLRERSEALLGDGMFGFTVNREDSDLLVVTGEITDEVCESADFFLSVLNNVVIAREDIDADRVVSMSSFDANNVHAFVHPQLQKLLNAGINEDEARRVLEAMMLPFPKYPRDGDEKMYFTPDPVIAYYLGANLIFRDGGFNVVRARSEEGHLYIEEAKPDWKDLGMGTIGNSVELGTSANERMNLRIATGERLGYRMTLNNVLDDQKARFSFMLGLGAMAHMAMEIDAPNPYDELDWQVAVATDLDELGADDRLVRARARMDFGLEI